MVAQNILDWFDINKLDEKYKQANKKALEARQEWEEKHPIISGIQKDYQPGYRAAVPRWEQAAEYGMNAPLIEQAKTGLKEFGLNLVPSVNIAVDAATGGSGTLTKQAVKQAIAKPLVPYVGKQIAKNTAESLIKGAEAAAIGGATQGVTSSIADNGISKDLLSRPILYGGMGLLTGGAFGGLGGFGAGQIGKQLARKNLLGNPEAQMNFARDYLEGLNDKVLTKQGFTLGDIRGLKAGEYGKLGRDVLLDQDAFHGTPFQGDIQKFDLDFMNTGEGAQMYGAGIYTAKDRNVANRHYRFLGDDIEPIKYKGQPLMTLYNNLEKQATRLHPRDAQPIYDKMSLLEDLDYKGGLDNLEYFSPDVQNWYKSEIEPNLTMPGRLYRVQVPDNDVLLHSELPLNEQPEKVQKALRDMFFDQGIDIDNPKNIYDNQKPYSEVSGQTLYNIMNGLIDGNATNRKATSQLFDEYGIKGVRAFGDRDGEIFVTFNPDNAKIMESYYPNKIYENPPKPLNKPKLSGKINYIDEMTDAEMAKITSEFNTNLTNAERKKKFVARAVGNYYYKARNNGFNDYKFIGRYLIDDLFD